MTRASFAFGRFSGKILIGNFGNGHINAFDNDGRFAGGRLWPVRIARPGVGFHQRGGLEPLALQPAARVVIGRE